VVEAQDSAKSILLYIIRKIKIVQNFEKAPSRNMFVGSCIAETLW